MLGDFAYYWVNEDNENEAGAGTAFGNVNQIIVHPQWTGNADDGYCV